MSEKILEVKDLNVSFHTYAGTSHAVRGIDFHLNQGETLAIVGESGCGKTVTSKAIMGLLPTPQTQIKKDGDSAILFHGENLLNYTCLLYTSWKLPQMSGQRTAKMLD